VLHIDVDPVEINKNRRADVGVVGDARRVLAAINKRLEETQAQKSTENMKARTAWHGKVMDWKAEHPYSYEPSDVEIKPQFLMETISKFAKGEAIVTVDVGQHQMWAAQYIKFNSPRLWQSSSGLGSMGFGIPSGMGAKVACPDKLVFSISGDGGFMMSLPEVATVVGNNIPLKMIIMNNGWLGMVRQWQDLFFDKRYSEVDMQPGFPDIPMLAASFGIKGVTVRQPADLEAAIQEMIDEPGPFLLNVMVTREENVYPMVPSGGALDEMILGSPKPVAAGD
jgi:acetolactate synthase-1/2/3 large subunit